MLYGKQFKKILKLELYDYCRYPGQWMNSILSGKVAATTDKTLNEYAPQLEIGYVFGNTGTIPTALAMPVPEGQDQVCSR